MSKYYIIFSVDGGEDKFVRVSATTRSVAEKRLIARYSENGPLGKHDITIHAVSEN